MRICSVEIKFIKFASCIEAKSLTRIFWVLCLYSEIMSRLETRVNYVMLCYVISLQILNYTSI